MTPSSNPMLLTDDEFAKWRQTQDPQADMIALAVSTYEVTKLPPLWKRLLSKIFPSIELK